MANNSQFQKVMNALAGNGIKQGKAMSASAKNKSSMADKLLANTGGPSLKEDKFIGPGDAGNDQGYILPPLPYLSPKGESKETDEEDNPRTFGSITKKLIQNPNSQKQPEEGAFGGGKGGSFRSVFDEISNILVPKAYAEDNEDLVLPEENSPDKTDENAGDQGSSQGEEKNEEGKRKEAMANFYSRMGELSPVGKPNRFMSDNEIEKGEPISYVPIYRELWPMLYGRQLADIAYNRQDPFAEQAWPVGDEILGGSADPFDYSPAGSTIENDIFYSPGGHNPYPRDIDTEIPVDFSDAGDPTELNNAQSKYGVDPNWRERLDFERPEGLLSPTSSQPDELADWFLNTAAGQEALALYDYYGNGEGGLADDFFTRFRLERNKDALSRILGFGDYADTGVAGWSGDWGRYAYNDLEPFYEWWTRNAMNVDTLFKNTNNISIDDLGGFDSMYDLYNYYANNNYYDPILQTNPETDLRKLVGADVAGRITADTERRLSKNDLSDILTILKNSGYDIGMGELNRKSPYQTWEEYTKSHPAEIVNEYTPYGMDTLMPILLAMAEDENGTQYGVM